jgi:hypothetical protein
MEVIDKMDRSKVRRDFPEWKVEAVYLAQDGCCLRCGGSLESGFHRHHKDGNPANNATENLELLCPQCHRATLGVQWDEHRKQEKRVLESLNKLIDEAFAGKIAGAVVERLVDALSLSLKVSKELSGIDKGQESPPASFVLFKRLAETRILQEAYLEGLKDGIRLFKKEVK